MFTPLDITLLLNNFFNSSMILQVSSMKSCNYYWVLIAMIIIVETLIQFIEDGSTRADLSERDISGCLKLNTKLS